jgi:hypothetical protein
MVVFFEDNTRCQPTRYWKSELDQMATTVLKPISFVDILVFAVEDNFVLPTD